jgi:cell division septation protein DedD
VRRPVSGYTVSFAALLVGDKARDLAASIRVGSENARVVTAVRDGSTIYRVVLGPYPTREEAERIGRESKQSYWIYEGGP